MEPVNNKRVNQGSIAFTPNQTLPNAMTAGMYAMVLSKNYAPNERLFLRCWAREQLRFAFLAGGTSKDRYSYVVGYGSRFPQNPQSRVAACDFTSNIPCDYDSALTFAQANPTTLSGALVAGPTSNLTYPDVRISDTSKVGVDYNAGLTGLLGAFNDKALFVSNNDCAYGKGVYQEVFKKIQFSN